MPEFDDSSSVSIVACSKSRHSGLVGQCGRAIHKTDRRMTVYRCLNLLLCEWKVTIHNIAEHATEWQALGVLLGNKAHDTLRDIGRRQ